MEQEIIPDSEFLYDLTEISHEFKGFGAQLWAYSQDEDFPELQKYRKKVLTELNIKYVRVPNSFESDHWEAFAKTKTMTDELGVMWVFLIWSAPNRYSDDHRMLVDVSGFAEYWKDLIISQYEQNINIEYVELMNEPDSKGAWSTGITPEDYNELVILLRAKLDSAGLENVGIVGPGPAAMWYFKDYAEALTKEGVSSHAAFSSHAWGTDGSWLDSADIDPGQFTYDTTVKYFRDPANKLSRDKPKFITEYSTHETTFEGYTYPHGDRYGEWDPDKIAPNYSVTNTMAYGVRCFTNTLALLNAGAEVPFIWQANDEPTESNPPESHLSEVSDKRKAWGLIDLSGNEKPVYRTLKTIYPKIPVGAHVLTAPNHEGEILYTGAFASEDQVIIGITNESDRESSARIKLTNTGKLKFNSALTSERRLKGDPEIGEPDICEIAEIKLKIIKSSPGAYYVDIVMNPLSTLTIVLNKKQ